MNDLSLRHEYPGNPRRPEARILAVEEFSPADDAGFVPGCIITAVNGHPLRDMIDWQWHSDGYEVRLSYIDLDGDSGEVTLERDDGESWGITFDGAIFDEIKTCRNACVFCFMRQLPEDARDSLMLRDDDWRLSFLQGNFTSLTALTEDEAEEIVERHVSPLRVSLHCITPEVRRKMIGRHAAHGVEMMERLLAGGIEMYMQIVLVPGLNDGTELMKTLAWAYTHEGVAHVGIVPIGFTKHQKRFERSFTEPEQAREVIELVERFQEHARAERGHPFAYLADEFYCNAYPQDLLEHLPPSEHYGGFDMFEDGIGIVRATLNEWEEAAAGIESLARALEEEDVRVYYVLGCAQKPAFTPVVESSALAGRLLPLYVENEYFGGNVNVTGLLTGTDVARAIRGVSPRDYVVLPRVMFNSDMLTLDDMSVDDIRDEAGLPVTVVSCDPKEYVHQIEELVRG